MGDRYGQAKVLTHIGETQHAAGDTASARASFQQALDILHEIGLGKARDKYPNANHIRALLSRLAAIDDTLMKRDGLI